MLFLLTLACSDYDVIKRESPPDPGDDTATDTAPPVDSAPPECPEAPGDEAVPPDDACRVDPPVGAFTPVIEWQWSENTAFPTYDDIMAAPVAGDVNGDGMPDVVFTNFSGGRYTDAGTLTAISGDGSGTHWSILDAGGFHPWSSGGVALGDLEGDGTIEVCVAAVEVAVLCVDGATGAFRWAAGTETHAYGAPAIADLEGDGRAEVIFGRQVFEADGTLRWIGTGSAARAHTFAADLDGDGTTEVIAGNTLYNADGSIRWTTATGDGSPAVGDFDGDGRGDVVHVAEGYVHLTGTDGTLRWSASIPEGGRGGPPTVADFDNDGQPEVGVAGASRYAVFDTDGTLLWSNPVSDRSSNVTGSSVFDFEGDGASDVVYGDELTLWVYDGATGAVKLQLDDHASGTLYEYPLILDVDADGASEIVLASNDYGYDGWNGITVIGDAGGTWRPSRGIWNQYAYSISNVLDDGSIPASPVPNWTRWNNFRAGGSLLGTSTQLADLTAGTPDVCTARCGEGIAEVVLPVGNAGLADTPAFAVALSRDGTRIAEERLALASGQLRHVGPFALTRAAWGAGVRARVDVDGEVEECDEDDNVVDLGAWPCD